MNTNEYPGVFCSAHIVYLFMTIAFTLFGIWLVLYRIKTEKTKNILIKITAACLLITICVNRFSVTYYQIAYKTGYTWLNLIPYTFCGLASLLLSITVLITKKEKLQSNYILHFICYYGFFGALASDIYPDYLYTQTFTDIRTLTGLCHHSLMLWLICLLLASGYLKPEIKKFPCYPIGYLCVMLLGFIEIHFLHFPSAMNIDAPLIASLPLLTSWYTIGILSTCATFLIEYLFQLQDKFHKNKARIMSSKIA